MTTWFEAYPRSYGAKVSPIEVERSTDKCVWIDGRRTNRMTSDWRCYFPTAAEAWDHVEQRAEARVEQAKKDLQYYRSELGKVQSERKAAGC